MKYVLLISLSLFLSGCVTQTNSSLTDKADPAIAVERYVQLGLEYIKRSDLHRARKHLSRALEISPEDASANASMALIYHQEGENTKAETLFKAAIVSDPKYTPARTYYGAFLFSQSQFKEALNQFQIASDDTRYEGRAQIFTNIALCQIRLNDNKAAIEAYLKALQLDRVNGIALSGITEVYILEKSYEKAQHYYNRLIRLIRESGVSHTAQSLWQGIRIAYYYNSIEQAVGLTSLLTDMYPDSEESMKAQSLISTPNTYRSGAF